MRTHHTGILLACLLLTWIAFITGCQKAERLPQPDFPLAKEAVTDTLEELSLDWSVERTDESVIETDKETTPTVTYSLRIPDDPADFTTVFINSYHSANFGRFLQATYHMNDAKLDEIRESRELGWEDWREVMELSAQLYGGFESAEEIYQACAALEIPRDEGRLWQGQLTGGYCVTEVRPAIQSWRSEKGGILSIFIYESEDAFQRMRQEAERLYQSRSSVTQSAQ